MRKAVEGIANRLLSNNIPAMNGRTEKKNNEKTLSQDRWLPAPKSKLGPSRYKS
jgi:hypothetical protein